MVFDAKKKLTGEMYLTVMHTVKKTKEQKRLNEEKKYVKLM